MQFLKCSCCGREETKDDLFIGIFSLGNAFGDTRGNIVGLYGCPNCHAMQYTADFEYIQMRKDLYKKKMKQRIK